MWEFYGCQNDFLWLVTGRRFLFSEKYYWHFKKPQGFLDFRSSWILRDQTCFNPKTFATSSPCFLFGHINFYKALTSAVKRNTHLCLPSVGFGQWSKNHLDSKNIHTKTIFNSGTVDIPKCQTYHPVTNRIILHCRLYLEILLATLNPYISTKKNKPLVGFFRLSGRKDLPRYPRSRHAWSLPSNVPGQASGSMGFRSWDFHINVSNMVSIGRERYSFVNISRKIRRFVDVFHVQYMVLLLLFLFQKWSGGTSNFTLKQASGK